MYTNLETFNASSYPLRFNWKKLDIYQFFSHITQSLKISAFLQTHKRPLT